MRRGGGVRGAAGEAEIEQQDGERIRLVHAGERRRMPGDRDIHVREGAVAHHEGLGRAAFLRGTAVIAHAARDALRGEPVLHRGRRQHRAGAEQVVAAGMPRPVAGQRTVLGDARLLAEPRQRVELAEDGDHRAPLARLAHDRGRDSGHAPGHAEAFLLQHGGMLGRGADFLEIELRHVPDPVAEGDERRLLRLDIAPDFRTVPHRAAPVAAADRKPAEPACHPAWRSRHVPCPAEPAPPHKAAKALAAAEIDGASRSGARMKPGNGRSLRT